MESTGMEGGAVFVQTNDPEGNAIVAYRRTAAGALAALGSYPTGGRGNGKPHLPSQSSVVLTADGRHLIVANTGSDDVSIFGVSAQGPKLAGRVPSGGSAPTSVAVHEGHVYVLNTGGEPNVSGFALGADGTLAALSGSTRPLPVSADPAQASFSPDGRTLVVTDRASNSLAVFSADEAGYLSGPAVHASSGATPYGFDFTSNGVLVVTEAFGGAAGAAAASSYELAGSAPAVVSGSVPNTRSEVCWAVVSKDDRFAYVTNFGDGTISSYRIGGDGSLELLDPVAASTVLGEKGVRDEALTLDGRYLYALDADARRVFGWAVGEDGSLAPVGDADGLPATAAGLAAS